MLVKMKGMGIIMKRNCSLEDISDGKLYDVNDMVKVSCNGCAGQASCCHGMGNSIILDPLDIFHILTNLNITFDELLTNRLELKVVDGVILPNLRMIGTNEGCVFLMNNGRCSIHSFRPGICRIFPMGRYYENHDFNYFLQVNECKNSSKTKIKLDKWIDTENIKKNKKFLVDWHYFLNDIEEIIRNTQDEKIIKNLNIYLLNSFYRKKYDAEKDFYLQFHMRLREAKNVIY
jgi:Predicted Fe-S-cluster oxidoreductase